MEKNLSYYINRFFLGGESNSFHGIKSIRYRVSFILEPVFLFFTLVSSIVVQIDILQNHNYQFLLFLYTTQFLLIILSIYFLNMNRLNRSYLLFILFLFSFFTYLNINHHSIYLWMFFSVLTSSLLFRGKRTAVIFFLFLMNVFFQNKDFFFTIIENPESLEFKESIISFALISSLITGLIISIIVYNLERSFLRLSSLKRKLDYQKSKLNNEIETNRIYKDALKGNELKFKAIIEYAYDGIIILD
ncbi:MAG: hypothetical protein JEY91_17070, partial [Spirochaetaceae bacterium]|nr:hypothetical protein [Spirochaetaceae bacterium]